jgi:hypothetical protein
MPQGVNVKQINDREGAKRQHRAIALFAVLQCWMRNLDGIVLDRRHLERLLGLERFRDKRMKWIEADFKDFFPTVEIYYYVEGKQKFGSLYLSRQELKGLLPDGKMSDKRRIEEIPKNGPRLAMFKVWDFPTELRDMAWSNEKKFQAVVPFFADFVNYDERLLASYLALLSQGQVSPQSLPWLTEGSSAIET